MKKVFIIALALVMALCFAACGGKKNEPASEPVAQVANPWVEVDAATISEKLGGFAFGTTADMQDVVYMWNESIGLAEMDFNLDGEWCARAQFADGFTDISGDYTAWAESYESVALGALYGEEYYAADSEGFGGLGLWYDEECGIMYSLDYRYAAEQFDFSFAAQVFPAVY